MGLRVYFCPIVGTGTETDPFRAKANDLGLQYFGELIPSKADGTPKFTWTLLAPRRSSWAAVDADPAFERLFALDLPDSIDTWEEVKTYLRSKTVADIPAARRQALNDRLAARGLDTSQVTLQTTWWQVLRGIVRQLNGGVLPDQDGVGTA